MDGPYDDLRDRLVDIAETLTERAYDQLLEAASAQDPSRAADEKRLLQARRAIEKAIRLLE